MCMADKLLWGDRDIGCMPQMGLLNSMIVHLQAALATARHAICTMQPNKQSDRAADSRCKHAHWCCRKGTMSWQRWGAHLDNAGHALEGRGEMEAPYNCDAAPGARRLLWGGQLTLRLRPPCGSASHIAYMLDNQANSHPTSKMPQIVQMHELCQMSILILGCLARASSLCPSRRAWPTCGLKRHLLQRVSNQLPVQADEGLTRSQHARYWPRHGCSVCLQRSPLRRHQALQHHVVRRQCACLVKAANLHLLSMQACRSGSGSHMPFDCSDLTTSTAE